MRPLARVEQVVGDHRVAGDARERRRRSPRRTSWSYLMFWLTFATFGFSKIGLSAASVASGSSVLSSFGPRTGR